MPKIWNMAKKLRKRLKDEEAKLLGLKLNAKEKGRLTSRYFITKDQWNEVLYHRYEEQNKGLLITGTTTLEDPDGNKIMQWVKRNKSKDDVLNAFKEALQGFKDEIEPTTPTEIKSHLTNDNLCNQYTLTDYHLGMMAWDEESGDNWDLKIAEETLVKFFETSIQQSPNASKAVFAQIGDFLHWDGLDAVTPANKHLLDADTRFTKLVRVAIRVIRKVITMLLQKYETVNVIMAEGNHDPASSVWLREMLQAFYENEPRLIIDTTPDPYYCITFGDCCLFYHHGHKRNINNIDSVFVSKYKKEFGSSKYVYAHTGHLHHEHKKETNLMILEQHRTLASKDSYASRGGWMSDRDSKVITYHKEFGEVGRLTINVNMLK